MEIPYEKQQELLDKAQSDPNWFISEHLGANLWDKQREIVEAVRDNPRVAVRSARGVGKTTSAAHIALWYIFAYPEAKVVTTAPVNRQVTNLWQEIRKAHRNSKTPLGGRVLDREIKFKSNPNRIAFGFASDKQENIVGYHAERMLVIIDEADGITDAIWDAIEGYLTSAHSRLLVISNPRTPSSKFAKEFEEDSDTKKIHVSVFDNPNFKDLGITMADIKDGSWEDKQSKYIEEHKELPAPYLTTPKWVRQRLVQWSEMSPSWSIDVLGEFPQIGDDNLIPPWQIDAAFERWEERKQEIDEDPISISVDVARFGRDETVMYARQGTRAWLIDNVRGADTMAVAGRAAKWRKRLDAVRIYVDGIGVGSGVVDRLKELDEPTYDAVASSKAKDSEQFANARAEWFWDLRNKFADEEIALDPKDEDIKGQLSAIRYKFERNSGRILMESKEEMKRRGASSPDRADSLAMVFITPKRKITNIDWGIKAGWRPSPWRY